MSEALRNLLERRSVRAFKSEQIKDEELQQILEAGKYAPSAANQQSWHFTVIQNKEVLQKINDVTKAVFGKSGNKIYEERTKAKDFSVFYHAPTYIIVSADEKAIAPVADSALALGNLFLAAEALGIGSVWIHAVNFLYTTEEGKALFKELGIPDGYIPYGSGAFGYNAGEKPKAAPRRQETVNIIK
ncbi:nitroreductase [Clostridium sp.]|jgi:nitroreductase|uniref:nitroreductase family protein n=1 Tax=Clostridium sp. TaxID=1506 RepID=UPI00258C215A|nr:nitroreductase [Clostridium sp.]MDF2502518.1 nitroreductase [Clostridium sp.]